MLLVMWGKKLGVGFSVELFVFFVFQSKMPVSQNSVLF